MSLKIGVLSTAHVHTPSFVSSFTQDQRISSVTVFDDNLERGELFAKNHNLTFNSDLTQVCATSDAVVICSENLRHAELIEVALTNDCHILCEKPVAASRNHLNHIQNLSQSHPNLTQMTAFPCRFSPTFVNLNSRIKAGDLGKLVAAATTNQGKCPGGWFTDPNLSGGGAMIDHVVHVADLLRVLTSQNPETVQAQIGSNMYGQTWDDTAMVTIAFPSGLFATIDSSWSRPKSYKTWGNVTLNLVGEKGVAEADLFVQGMDVTTDQGITRYGSGSNIDRLMVKEFIDAVTESRPPSITLEDGLWASRVAVAAYESVNNGGQPQPV